MHTHTIHPPTQAQHTADDKLDAIAEMKKDVRKSLNRWREVARKVGISTGDWINTAEAIEQAVDEPFFHIWHKNRDISGRIDYPVDIPKAYDTPPQKPVGETTIAEDVQEFSLRLLYAGYLQTNKSACMSFEEWKETTQC